MNRSGKSLPTNDLRIAVKNAESLELHSNPGSARRSLILGLERRPSEHGYIVNMFSNIFRGLCAGAAGSTALNITTYIDMLLTGRSASSTPEETVRRLAAKLHCEYFSKSDEESDASLNARRSALGVLLGYANGIGVAVLAAEWRRRRQPFLLY